MKTEHTETVYVTLSDAEMTDGVVERIRAKYYLLPEIGWSYLEHDREGTHHIFTFHKMLRGPTTINNENDTLDV